MPLGLGDEGVYVGHDLRPGQQACLGLAHHGGRGEYQGAVGLFVGEVTPVTSELAEGSSTPIVKLDENVRHRHSLRPLPEKGNGAIPRRPGIRPDFDMIAAVTGQAVEWVAPPAAAD